jgi:hypothetical protein
MTDVTGEQSSESKKPGAHAAASTNVPKPVISLIALLFTGAMIWNIVIKGEGMVTIALASAIPFIIGVPVGARLLGGGDR